MYLSAYLQSEVNSKPYKFGLQIQPKYNNINYCIMKDLILMLNKIINIGIFKLKSFSEPIKTFGQRSLIIYNN